MRTHRLIGLAFALSLTLDSSCRVQHLSPKRSAETPTTEQAKQSLTAINRGQTVHGIAVDDLLGVWELKSIQRQVESIDIASRLNTHIYLSLNEDASAQWYRDDLDLLGYCDSDLMSVGLDSSKEQLFFNYSYIKLNEQTGELEGQAHVEQIAFTPELAADKLHLTLAAGQVPWTIAVIPEIPTKFDPAEKVNVYLEKATVDIRAAQSTVMYKAVCDRKNTIFQSMKGGISQPVPTPNPSESPKPEPEQPGNETTPEPVKDEQDDLDADTLAVKPSFYRVVQGKPSLFDHFELDKDLVRISQIESGSSDYLKVVGADKKNVIVEVDFDLGSADFDAIRLSSSMKSDSRGQFIPGYALSLRSQDPKQPQKVLEQLYSGPDGLDARDHYFTTTLRKNLDQYVFQEDGKHILHLTLELDYAALSACRILSLIPCWERPSLLLDFIGIELIKFPRQQVENKCSLNDIKGPWEFIRQKKTEDSPWLVIANGDLNTEKKIAIATRADWLEDGKLVRQTYGYGKDLSLNVQGWTRCPDLRYTYTFDPKTCEASFTNTKSGAVEVLRMDVDKAQTPWVMRAYRVSGDTEYVNEYQKREALDLPFVLLNVKCKE